MNLQAEGIAGQERNTDQSFDDEVFGNRQGLHGFNVAATGFFWDRLGLTGDFSYNQKQTSSNSSGQQQNATQQNERTLRVLNFLAGPTVKFKNVSRPTPFLHALAGVANTRFNASTSSITSTGTVRNEFETSTSDFALALGGGIDVRVNERFDVRLIQGDWNPVFLGDRSIQRLNAAGTLATQNLPGQRADNVRLSVGVVIK